MGKPPQPFPHLAFSKGKVGGVMMRLGKDFHAVVTKK